MARPAGPVPAPMYILGDKETSEEPLSPSKRIKTEGSNAELIVELINEVSKTSLPKPKKWNMVKVNPAT